MLKCTAVFCLSCRFRLRKSNSATDVSEKRRNRASTLDSTYRVVHHPAAERTPQPTRYAPPGQSTHTSTTKEDKGDGWADLEEANGEDDEDATVRSTVNSDSTIDLSEMTIAERRRSDKDWALKRAKQRETVAEVWALWSARAGIV